MSPNISSDRLIAGAEHFVAPVRRQCNTITAGYGAHAQKSRVLYYLGETVRELMASDETEKLFLSPRLGERSTRKQHCMRSTPNRLRFRVATGARADPAHSCGRLRRAARPWSQRRSSNRTSRRSHALRLARGPARVVPEAQTTGSLQSKITPLVSFQVPAKHHLARTLGPVQLF